jgi:hypothetical protein
MLRDPTKISHVRRFSGTARAIEGRLVCASWHGLAAFSLFAAFAFNMLGFAVGVS